MQYIWLSDAPLNAPPGVWIGFGCFMLIVALVLYLSSFVRIGDTVDRSTVPPNAEADPEAGSLSFRNIFGLGPK